uniref:Uncharacterized protein n=1 Tax=Panagrolaimus superbus TaxID=310955 RepID=A0A914YZS7_9BILA
MKEELWLLKLPGSINQQLLKLDKLIYSSEHRYSTMSIIEPEKGQQWVVMSKVIFDENEDFEELSLIICPVSDIREIVFAGIRFIDYTNNKNLLRWQTKRDIEDEEQEVEEKRNFAEWLHQTLLEVSGDYRQQHTPPNLPKSL